MQMQRAACLFVFIEILGIPCPHTRENSSPFATGEEQTHGAPITARDLLNRQGGYVVASI
jgi:hypothetical protein